MPQHSPLVWVSETPKPAELEYQWCEECLHEVTLNHLCGPCSFCEGEE